MNLFRMLPLRPWSCAARVVAAAIIGVAAAGCSDDSLRCHNVLDCEQYDEILEAISSNRVQAKCYAPGEGDGDGDFAEYNHKDRVCSVVDADIGCNPESYMSQPYYGMLYDEAASSRGIYIPCAEENRGTHGCRPRLDGSCDDSLVVNDFGACDEAGAGFPAVTPGPENRGFDVRDQFCRSFFCKDNFVCDTSRSWFLCRECDPSKPLGEGGCAQLYFNGAPSPVYTSKDALEANCPDVSSTELVTFGPLPTAP